jgi:hypothetical protein
MTSPLPFRQVQGRDKLNPVEDYIDLSVYLIDANIKRERREAKTKSQRRIITFHDKLLFTESVHLKKCNLQWECPPRSPSMW